MPRMRCAPDGDEAAVSFTEEVEWPVMRNGGSRCIRGSMLNTTLQAIRAVLLMDTTVSTAERNRIIQRLKGEDTDRAAPPTPQRLLRRRDVAERLGMSLRTVDNLHKDGVLEKVRFPGRVRAAGFREADVNSLLSAGDGGQGAVRPENSR
jgi:predicted DNA-binding transcriptional regulator AlpA